MRLWLEANHEEFNRRCFGFARKLGLRREDCKDLISDLKVKLLEYEQPLRNEDPWGLIFVSLRNLIHSWFEKNSNRRQREIVVACGEAPPPLESDLMIESTLGSLRRLPQGKRNELVNRAIGRLEDKEQITAEESQRLRAQLEIQPPDESFHSDDSNTRRRARRTALNLLDEAPATKSLLERGRYLVVMFLAIAAFLTATLLGGSFLAIGKGEPQGSGKNVAGHRTKIDESTPFAGKFLPKEQIFGHRT